MASKTQCHSVIFNLIFCLFVFLPVHFVKRRAVEIGQHRWLIVPIMQLCLQHLITFNGDTPTLHVASLQLMLGVG